MSSKISLWTGLIGIGATIAIIQPVAAKSSVEIADTARAITVLITEPNSVGSGVILQNQGDIYTVLTAAHVVTSKASYKITTSDDRSYEVISSSIRPAPGSIDKMPRRKPMTISHQQDRNIKKETIVAAWPISIELFK